jgi:hypothetical protein
MNAAIAVTIFLVVAAVGIGAKWYGLKDSLSMYSRSTAPNGHRFSLSTFLVACISLAVGFGLFVMWLNRG